jgi:hypothetical protein
VAGGGPDAAADGDPARDTEADDEWYAAPGGVLDAKTGDDSDGVLSFQVVTQLQWLTEAQMLGRR